MLKKQQLCIASYTSGSNLSGIASQSAMRISSVCDVNFQCLRCKFYLKSKNERRIRTYVRVALYILRVLAHELLNSSAR